MLLRKIFNTRLWGLLAVWLIIASVLLLFAGPGALFASADAWHGSYWNNTDLSGSPDLVRYDSAIDFDWEGLSPDPIINVDNFSARWVRTVGFSNGTYRFRATMDDGMRAWVDGNMIIDGWKEGKRRTIEADVPLSDGPHTITVEYYEKGGKAIAGFTWDMVYYDGPAMPMPPTYPQQPTYPQPPGPPSGPEMPSSGDVIYPVGVVKSPYLNMRSGPGTKYHVVAVLQQHTQLYIIARSSGSTWYLVKTPGGPTGWVKRYYVHTDFPYTSLPFADSGQGGPSPKPPVHQPTQQPSGTVNVGALNVRSGPGINYRTIAVVNGGTTVVLLGRNGSGSWLKVKIPTGSVGWVNGFYISTSYPIQNLPSG
jgi:uncharacterized protein YraI